MKIRPLHGLIAFMSAFMLFAGIAAPANAAADARTSSASCATGKRPYTKAKVSVLSGTYYQRHIWLNVNDSGTKYVTDLTWYQKVGTRTGTYVVQVTPSFVSFTTGCVADPV